MPPCIIVLRLDNLASFYQSAAKGIKSTSFFANNIYDFVPLSRGFGG